MAQKPNHHGRTSRVLSASTIVVLLFAAAPAEAGWLGRGIAVGGVGYSVKKNLGELIDDAGEVLSGAIEGDTKRVEAGWQEVRRFPIKLIVDAFPVLRIGSGVNERVASAKARVKQLFDRTGKAIAGPRVALVVSDEEEARLLGGPRLPVVRPRHFAVLGTPEPSKEPRGEPDKGLSQVPGGDQAPADHAAVEAGLGLTAEGKVLVQTGLAAMNYEVGPADGIFGKKTRGAIRAWQEAQGSAGTGYLTKEQAERLREAGAEARYAARERERKEREKAEQQRVAREAAERERLAREGREKMEAARKAREQAASALKDVEAKNCIVWGGGRLGYWRGPCVNGLASGKGSAVLTATCGRWRGSGCVARGKEQLANYEGSAKHGFLSGLGILTRTDHGRDGKVLVKLEGEFRQGGLVKGTLCRPDNDPPCYDVNEEGRWKEEVQDPTCRFKVWEHVAVYWLGSCVDGLASGKGVAVAHHWRYFGYARDGRAHGFGGIFQYLDVDVNANSVNLFPSFRRTTSSTWSKGRVLGRANDQLFAPPHYHGCEVLPEKRTGC